MAETFRIEIKTEVKDNTDPGVASAKKKLTGFDKVVEKTHTRLKALNSQKVRMILTALDRASGVIGRVSASARSASGKAYHITMGVIDKATAPLRAIMRFATGIGGALFGAGAAAGGLFMPLKLFADFEQTQISMETMLGSAEKASALIAQIENYAARTPFESTDIMDATKTLLNYQVANEDVMETMKRIGDVSLGNNDKFQALSLAYGQANAAGKLQGQDLNQMVQAGWNPLNDIIKITGETMAQVRKRMEAGGVSATELRKALAGATSQGGMFYQSLLKQSTSLYGLLSTFKDTVKNSLIRKWGEGLAAGIKPMLLKAAEWIDVKQDKIKAWGESWKTAGTNISTYVMDKVSKLKSTIAGMTGSQEWKDATTLGAKMKIAWNTIITQPFNEWWSSSGQAWLSEKAASIGKGFGSGLSAGLLALLGIDLKGAGTDGQSIGASFASGFIAGFNGAAVKAALKESLKDLAPGGDKPGVMSYVTGGVLTWGAIQMAKLVALGGKGGKWLSGLFKGGSGAAAAEATGSSAGSAASTANKFADYGMSFGTGTKAATGILSKIKPIFGKFFDRIFGGTTGMVNEWAIDDAWEKSFGSVEGQKTMSELEQRIKKWWNGSTLCDFIMYSLGKTRIDLSKYTYTPNIIPPKFSMVGTGSSGSGSGSVGTSSNPSSGQTIVPITPSNKIITFGDTLPHANGGIMNKPHMGLVAENGPEGIIPLSPSKRNRGISLWRQAGAMLGVSAYEDGGMPVVSGGGTGGVSININVKADQKFNIEGGADEDAILAKLKAGARDMADDIGDEIADKLSMIFGNMPIKGFA